jgi:hypothetical protein
MLYMHKHDIGEMGHHSHCITKHHAKYETRTKWERKKCHTLDYWKNSITIVLQMGECMNEWTNLNVIL